MSQMKVERPETLIAAGAISKFRFLVISGDYTVSTAGAGAGAYGVSLDNPTAAGDGCLVATNQWPKLEAGGAFAAGAYLKPDASGRGVTATTGQLASAQAKQASTALGDVVEIAFIPGGIVVP